MRPSFRPTVAFSRWWRMGRCGLICPLCPLMVKRVGESTEASHPFWAPDSSAVGFFADGKLKRVAASGGAS